MNLLFWLWNLFEVILLIVWYVFFRFGIGVKLIFYILLINFVKILVV